MQRLVPIIFLQYKNTRAFWVIGIFLDYDGSRRVRDKILHLNFLIGELVIMVRMKRRWLQKSSLTPASSTWNIQKTDCATWRYFGNKWRR